MKILILSNKFPYPPKDGGAIAKFNLIKGLYKLGHELTVLAMNTPKHFTDVESLPDDVKKMADFNAVFVDTIIKLHKALFNILFSRLPYNASRFISKQYATKLTQILKSKSFDLIQLEGLYVCPYINEIRKVTDTPVVLRAHNIEHEIWFRGLRNERSVFRRWYLKNMSKRLEKFERSFVNKYDLLVPISGKDNEMFSLFGNKKPSFVLPTGIEEGFIRSDYQMPEKNTLFHIGGLDWGPNQEGLIWFLENVWGKVRQKIPGIQFVVAGRNAPDWFVHILTKSGVEFKGEVESAVNFIDDHKIMVVPLLSGSGMRIKIIEGLARGKVIISTAIGAEGIDCEHGRNILFANTPEDFVNSIELVVQNPAMCRKLSENAIKLITEKYNNLEITSKLTDFYNDNI